MDLLILYSRNIHYKRTMWKTHPVIILVFIDVIKYQRCLRKRALKAKLYKSLKKKRQKDRKKIFSQRTAKKPLNIGYIHTQYTHYTITKQFTDTF